MALYVNTNVSSLNGQRKLANATNALNTTYQRLASGLRINGARDDAAGLQISNRMTSQIEGLNQGNRNCNDGVALAQTAEGAMDEMTNMLHRIRVLSIQSANGSNTNHDREAIQEEVEQLSREITRIAKRTTFNGETILSGPKDKWGNQQTSVLDSQGKCNFQVGSNAYDILSVDLSKGFSVRQMTEELLINQGELPKALTIKDEATIAADPKLKDLDDVQLLQKGLIRDSFAKKIVKGSEVTEAALTKDFTTSAFAGSDKGAYAAPANMNNNTNIYITKEAFEQICISASEIDTDKNDVCASARTLLKGIFGINIEGVPGQLASAKSPATAINEDFFFDVTTQDIAQKTLERVDKYLGIIDSKRAEFGAVQNRMEATIRNQANIAENTTDARSRIRDTDFAEETAILSAQTILQQSSQTVLTQANQRPQIALSLLGG